MIQAAKLQPAKRVAGRRQDVWSIVNEGAAASPKQPIVNMGQGFFDIILQNSSSMLLKLL